MAHIGSMKKEGSRQRMARSWQTRLSDMGPMGGGLRAIDALKRRKTNRAAAIKTPVNLPTWGQFAAVIRTFQEGGAKESLSMAKADHKVAYKQLPVRGGMRCWRLSL